MGFDIKEGRGYVDPDTYSMKVMIDKEGVWVKIIAIHKSKKKGIGIMMNTMFSNKYKWGEFVNIVDDNPKEIAHITKKVTSIPNVKGWHLL